MNSLKQISDFNSFAEMLEMLPDDTACRNYLEKMRWNNEPACPHCGVMEHYVLKKKGEFNGMYKCKNCKERYTVTIGTMFEGSHISLRKWFIAIYIFWSHKKGISSHQLGKDLGITQKSAWFMLGRIRFAEKSKTIAKKIEGAVMADESFFGGKNKNRHADKKIPDSGGRSVKDKTPVLGIMLVGGQVRTRVIADTKASTLQPIIKEMVAQGSIVITDEWHGYKGVSKDYNYVIVNHKDGEYARGAFHTNGIENFWSHLKRGIYGIYHQVSPKHLHRYCDEFAYRYNTRKVKDNQRFNFSLQNTECRLIYKELVSK